MNATFISRNLPLTHEIYICLQNHLKKEQFFSAKSARVIWIHSKSVPVVDAKLCVYKKYQDNIRSGNMWMHHDHDGNVDEIKKLIVIQKLKSLSKTVSSVCNLVCDFQKSDLNEAIAEIFSKENVTHSCEAVSLPTHYLSIADEDKMKQTFFHEVKKSVCLQIMKKIFTLFVERANRILHTLEGSVLTISPSTLELMSSTFFPAIEKVIPSAFIDIKTKDYRKKFAHAFSNSIRLKQSSLFNEIECQFHCILKKTKLELSDLDGYIKTVERSLVLPDQEKCK